MKLRKRRFFALSTITMVTLLVNLAFPITVFADDETPPMLTEEPVSPPAEESTGQLSVEEPPFVDEQPTVAEVLEQLPEDVQIVVLNQEGETIPLVTEEAASIIQTIDPVWCPLGLVPGQAGCTTNFATPQLLINNMDGSNPATTNSMYEQDGIIYFTANPGGAFVLTPGGGNSVDLADYNVLKNFNLTLQGGWNGLNFGAGYVLSGQTDFGSNNIQIGTSGNQWVGNITLNDIATNGVSTANGITIYTTAGDIVLNNVDVVDQAGNFSTALLNSASGDINVENDSLFDGNVATNSKGFTADTTGSITITDTIFSDTFNSIDNRNGATLTGSTVDLDGIQATGNDFNGIKINATSDVSLNDVVASYNGADGVKIEVTGGNVLVENSYFDHNSNNGLGITTDSGYIELNNNYSYENTWNGASLVSAGDVTFNLGSYDTNDRRGILLEVDGGDVVLNGVQLSENEFAGIYAEILSENDFTLNHIVTEYNGNYGAYIDTLGDVFVQGGSEFKNNAAAGLFINQTDDLTINDDVTYGGSVFSANEGHGLRAEYINGDVYIENGTFTLNDLRGLSLPDIAGSIEIISSDFLENDGGGAYLDNSCGCTISDITITSSNFNENGWTGLEAYSDGNINLQSVNANDNDHDGAYLDTTYGTGSIIMTGTNVFNNNDGAGLVIEAGGNVTLSNVTANYNSTNGAWVDNTFGAGDVSIYESTFDYNVEDDFAAGLNVDSNGFVTLSNISASNNNGDGVVIGYEAYTSDPSYPGWSGVLIENSVFNDNWSVFDGFGYGLYLEYGNGNVIIDNITASGNLNTVFIGTAGNVTINTSTFTNTGSSDGAYLEIEGNADICNTTFSGNDGYGLHAEFVDGNLTLNDNIFGGNGSGDYSYGDSGTLTVTNGGGCNPAPNGNDGGDEGSVERDDSQSSQASSTGNGGRITCNQTQTTRTVRLFNGDLVTLPCPINEYAVVNSTLQTDLPAPVEGNFEFTSALTVRVIRNGQSIESLNEPVLVSFLIPKGKDAKDLTILFWDGTELQDFGGTGSADGLYFEISTMQLGTFVLVRK